MSGNRPRCLPRNEWLACIKAGAPRDTPVRKGYVADALLTKAIDFDNRIAPIVISTGAVDRSRDIVNPDGWELDDYRANPIVLFGHDHWSFPIGQSLDTASMGGRLVALAQFAAREESPEADTAFQLIAGRYLRGVSPGFRPLEWTYNEERQGVDYERQLLLEASIVPVPDNQEALVMAKAAGVDLAPWRRHAERALDTWPRKGAAPDVDRRWFETLYRLAGGTMKGKKKTVKKAPAPQAPERGKSVHIGAVLAKAIESGEVDKAVAIDAMATATERRKRPRFQASETVAARLALRSSRETTVTFAAMSRTERATLCATTTI